MSTLLEYELALRRADGKRVYTPLVAEHIVRAAAAAFDLEPADTEGACPPGSLREQGARLASWALRKITIMSFQQIANYLRLTDHTTIMNRCRAVEERRKREPEYQRLTDEWLEHICGELDAQKKPSD